jgi:hypothetical protein
VVREPGRFQVGADGLHRGPVVLDEGGVGRAPAQGLDAEGAGAGEQVEDGGALQADVGLEGVEDRLPHEVGRRAGGLPLGGDEAASPRDAGHHAHGR